MFPFTQLMLHTLGSTTSKALKTTPLRKASLIKPLPLSQAIISGVSKNIMFCWHDCQRKLSLLRSRWMYRPSLLLSVWFCLFWLQSIESSKFGSSETHRNPTTGYRTGELFVSKRVHVLKGTKKLLVTRSYSDMSLFFSQSTSPSQKDLLHTIYNNSSSHKPT